MVGSRLTGCCASIWTRRFTVGASHLFVDRRRTRGGPSSSGLSHLPFPSGRPLGPGHRVKLPPAHESYRRHLPFVFITGSSQTPPGPREGHAWGHAHCGRPCLGAHYMVLSPDSSATFSQNLTVESLGHYLRAPGGGLSLPPTLASVLPHLHFLPLRAAQKPWVSAAPPIPPPMPGPKRESRGWMGYAGGIRRLTNGPWGQDGTH